MAVSSLVRFNNERTQTMVIELASLSVETWPAGCSVLFYCPSLVNEETEQGGSSAGGQTAMTCGRITRSSETKLSTE